VLESLAQEPSVRSAYLFTSDGQLLAEYLAPGEILSVPLSFSQERKSILSDDRILVYQPVILNDKPIGTLYLDADFRELKARTVYRLILWSCILFGAVILAFIMTVWGNRFFIQPILALADLAHKVGSEQQYSLRARKTSGDELGNLVDSFNSMLDVIEERDRAIAKQTHALQDSNKALEEARDTLEMRVEERTYALQASEKKFKALLESAPDAIIISSEDGVIELVNAQAEKLFGYRQQELIGEKVEILLPERVRHKHVSNREMYVRNPEIREMGAEQQLFAVRKDGSEFPVDVSLSPIKTVQGMKVAAAVRDITQRRQNEKNMRAIMEELERSNEELEQKSQELEAQQEELQQNNEELEEQRAELEEEKEKLELLTRELEVSQIAFEEKAREANIANQYKSEFLANMSHELRTPLNSIMILSQIMGENTVGNLTDEQIRNVKTIYSSGNDLLALINDILDLSKVEAGKLELNFDTIEITDIIENLRRTFALQIREKGLEFHIRTATDLPVSIRTDQVRLEQILKNLVSNAMKFTESGSVIMDFEVEQKTDSGHTLKVSVEDTGIGIPEDKQAIVFEAFRQIDSSLSRRYSGTGLGLSISQTLARKLGGAISLHSITDKGSTFTLRIPIKHAADQTTDHVIMRDPPDKLRAAAPTPVAIGSHPPFLPDDQIILIIEDDYNFAGTLIDKCQQNNFKCLHADNGADGLKMAVTYLPQAIILDLRLPYMSGVDVLDQLKSDPGTRHIPVNVMSIEDRESEVLRLGAVGFLKKPVSIGDLDEVIRKIDRDSRRATREVLLIEDDRRQCEAITQLLAGSGINVKSAHSVDQAIDCLQARSYDCIILDLDLGGEDGLQVLRTLENNAKTRPAVVVYTGKDLSRDELKNLEQQTDVVIIKGTDSHTRLLDEVTLFLHSVQAKQPRKEKFAAQDTVLKEEIFLGKKVLLVDDDVRNIYSLRQILLLRGLEAVPAYTGKEAIDVLAQHDDIDMVLMDIMMPEMNGIDAIIEIRKQIKYRDLPIIALTAKAMKHDRDECLEAGANDYLSKPVDVTRLLSLIRVWLSK
jgi:PAS domain S-box-containing protein